MINQHDHPHTVLSVASMCTYPPMDGASVRIISVAAALGAAGYVTTVIGRDFMLTMIPGQPVQVDRFEVNGWRSKRAAGLRAICTAGHYSEIKFHNRAWERVVQDHVNAHQPDALIANYIWALDVVQHLHLRSELVVYDTLNSEWQMYDTLIQESHNPFHKWIWRNATARYDTVALALPSTAVLMHITEADLLDHQARHPTCSIFWFRCALSWRWPVPSNLIMRLHPSGCCFVDHYRVCSVWMHSPTLRTSSGPLYDHLHRLQLPDLTPTSKYNDYAVSMHGDWKPTLLCTARMNYTGKRTLQFYHLSTVLART